VAVPTTQTYKSIDDEPHKPSNGTKNATEDYSHRVLGRMTKVMYSDGTKEEDGEPLLPAQLFFDVFDKFFEHRVSFFTDYRLAKLADLAQDIHVGLDHQLSHIGAVLFQVH